MPQRWCPCLFPAKTNKENGCMYRPIGHLPVGNLNEYYHKVFIHMFISFARGEGASWAG